MSGQEDKEGSQPAQRWEKVVRSLGGAWGPAAARCPTAAPRRACLPPSQARTAAPPTPTHSHNPRLCPPTWVADEPHKLVPPGTAGGQVVCAPLDRPLGVPHLGRCSGGQ